MQQKTKPTETEILESIKRVSDKLKSKFRFGYHENDDIEQEITIICLKAMSKYDGERSLDNFLWVSCKNRLCNFKRNKYIRLEPPCIECPFFDPKMQQSTNQCSKFLCKSNCQEYEDWCKKTDRKKDLVNKAKGGDIGVNNNLDKEFNYIDSPHDVEKILETIDRELPVELREDYVKFKYGIKLHHNKKTILMAAINLIVKNFNLKDE